MSAAPSPNNKSDGNNPNACVSDKLAVCLDTQVSPNDLLVVRAQPLKGNALGNINSTFNAGKTP